MKKFIILAPLLTLSINAQLEDYYNSREAQSVDWKAECRQQQLNKYDTETYREVYDAMITKDHARVKRLIQRAIALKLPHALEELKKPEIINYAAINGYTDIIQLLLRIGADINDGPIMNAIHNNRSKTITFLLNNGANITNLYELLNTAVKANSNYAVHELFKRGDKRNITHKELDYLLQSAVLYGKNVQIIKVLLTHGASPTNNDTLHHAAYRGDKHIISILLNHGASINAQGGPYSYLTPLHNAVDYRKHAAAQLLLKRGADVNKRDTIYNETPLMTAVKRNDLNMVNILLAHGAHTRGAYALAKTPAIIRALRKHDALFWQSWWQTNPCVQ